MVLPWLPDLVGRVSTIEDRLAISAVLVGLLLVIGWLARRISARIDLGPENLERAANAGIALVLLVTAAIVGGALLTVWGISLSTILGATNPVTLLTRLVLTVVLVLGVYVLTGVVKRVVHEFSDDRAAITKHQTELVFRSTQVSLYVLAAIVTFGIWNVDLSGLLVGAGFLGIVVGLAARQTLGSLIAGFVLMFARPFEIGDWVAIGDRDGIVTEISIVNTRIQNPDGEYVMIPNDVVGSSEVVNRTRKGRLRIHVPVGVDYDTDLDQAVEAATEAVRNVDEVLTVPQPQVVIEKFDTSAIVLDLRFWIDKPSARRRNRAQTAAIAAVKSAFDRERIKIPFPQRELSGRAEAGGLSLAGESAGVDATPGDAGQAASDPAE